MSAGFPLRWETWSAGVKEAYKLKAELDRRDAAGEVLFREERQTHKRVTDIVARYYPSGKKRRGVKRRVERAESVGATVVSLAFGPGGIEPWRPDLEGAQAEIDNPNWRSEV
jgi:hypothetical protein